MTTIHEFIAAHNLTMTVKPASNNPNMIDQSDKMHHYSCTLRAPNGWAMLVPFSMGSALTHEPTIAEVLDCLASDAGSFEGANQDFEQWCGEFDYDTDSRKAERTFNTIEEQSEELKRFLGDDAYNDLLWKVGRE